MRLRARQNRLLHQTAVCSVGSFVLVTTLAFGKDIPPSTPSSISVQHAPSPLTPGVALSPEETVVPAVYRSRGRRDPFQPPRVKTVEKPPTVHLKLTGIIREAHSYYALVESDSSPSMGYIIRENDVVDSAKVVKITENSVVFAVQTKGSEGKLITRYVEKHMPPVESRQK